MEEEDTGEEVSDSSGTVRPPAGFKILGYEQRWEVALLLPFNKALLLFGVCLYNLRGLETLKYKAGSFIVVFFFTYIQSGCGFHMLMDFIYPALVQLHSSCLHTVLHSRASAGARVKPWQLCPYLVKLCDDSTYRPSASNPDYFGGKDFPGTSEQTAAARRQEENTSAILTFTS